MKPLVPVAKIATLLAFAFLYIPIGVIVINAFNADENLLEWSGGTWRWFGEAVDNEKVREAFTTSVWVALVVAVLSVAVSAGAVLGLQHLPRLSRTNALTTLPRIVLPEVVITIAIFLVTRSRNVPLGAMLVITAEVVLYSAYAFVVIQSRFSTIPSTYADAAADLGATPLRVVRRVSIPLLAPSIVVAALMCFTFSLDNVVSATFLSGTGMRTLPVTLMGMIRQGGTAEVNAIAVLAMVLSLIPLIVALAILGVRGVGAVGGGRADSGEKLS